MNLLKNQKRSSTGVWNSRRTKKKYEKKALDFHVPQLLPTLPLRTAPASPACPEYNTKLVRGLHSIPLYGCGEPAERIHAQAPAKLLFRVRTAFLLPPRKPIGPGKRKKPWPSRGGPGF